MSDAADNKFGETVATVFGLLTAAAFCGWVANYEVSWGWPLFGLVLTAIAFAGSEGAVIAIAIVILAAVGGGIFYAGYSYGTSRTSNPFTPYIAGYAAIKPVQPEVRQQTGSKPIVGRTVIVDTRRMSIHQAFFDLPDDLRAEKPDDVALVTLVSCRNEKVADYQFAGAWGAQAICDVKVVELATKLLLGSAVIKGSRPPSYISARRKGEVLGSIPQEEIADWFVGFHNRGMSQ
jgi:hypothetical protein